VTTIQQAVGTDKYEQMRRVLKKKFPDDKAAVSDLAVDVAFQVAKHVWKAPELAHFAIPPLMAAAPVAPQVDQAAAGYYVGHATHARAAAPGSVFTGHLPLVRFQLPQRGTTQTLKPVHTPAGEVLPVDRLNPSIDVLWETYKNDPLLTFGRPERVDMITPPRLFGARFGAVSLYLCYAKASDVGPSFYILEAGLATGQPRIPFLGRTMQSEILAKTQYKPTTFSQPSHVYRGTLEMRADAPGEPQKLTVRIFEKGPPLDKQYLAVTVVYEKRATPLLTHPFLLTAEAGARVQAIADALGVPSGLDEKWFLRLIDAVSLKDLFSTPPSKSATV
jgi:hypothetical protein